MHLPSLAVTAALALGAYGGDAQAVPPFEGQNVRVHAHILLVDRTEAARVGLRYAQVGGGLVGVHGMPAGRRGGGVLVSGDVDGVPVSAFVDLARERGVLRSETRTQVLALSGSAAAVASGTVATGRWGGTRVRGPELMVTPTVLEDGRVLLEVRARLRDEVTGAYGYHRADGSPVDVATTVVVRPGEDATIGSVQMETNRSDAGFLRWEGASQGLDILVVLRPEIVGRP